MKRLVAISYSNEALLNYKMQLESYFGEVYEFEGVAISELENIESIDADIVLLSTVEAVEGVLGVLKNNVELITAKRTITKDALELIMSIESGKKTYVVDEDKLMAEEMISTLYQLGVNHLKFEPYYPESNKGLNTDEVAEYIVFGNTSCTLPSKGIVDGGHTLLDISTIMDIAVKLGLSHTLRQRSLEMEYKEVVTKDYGMAEIIANANTFESQLKIILDAAKTGIINVDNEGIITSINEEVLRLIELNSNEMIGRRVDEVITGQGLLKLMKERSEISDKLIKINGIDVIMSVKLLLHSKRFYGAILILKKYSELEKQQYKLRAQIIGKGHKAKYSFDDIIGNSDAIEHAKTVARRMAKSESSILISGESGTGKELFAHAIHRFSTRSDKQFVAVNCGAFPESLLESELFGYEEGAFTGARRGGKTGLFELAHGGTLFLDEIGEMPLKLQMRLLRVLQEREVMRIGGDRVIDVDVRIIAATNKNLYKMVSGNEFRRDLYYRLNVLPLKITPLRERKEDIFPLINSMKNEFAMDFELTEKARGALLNHKYPGNVRELRNYIEYFANMHYKCVDVHEIPFDEVEEHRDVQEESDAMKTLEPLFGKHAGDLFEVLVVLKAAYEESRRMGRRGVYEALSEKKVFIGELRIRDLLLMLQGHGFVEIGRGRAGTILTAKGYQLIN